MRRIIIILICNIFILNGKIVFPQDDLHIQFEFAKKLFNDEKYFDAITEFKRLLFFAPTNVYEFEANYLIALSYKQGGFFTNASDYFSKALTFSKNKDEEFKTKIELIRLNILRYSTSIAHNQLDELQNDSTFNYKLNEIFYWRGWNYIFADEWDKASNEFSKIDSNHFMKKFCEQIIKEKKSVFLAKILSYFIPGSGQIYTGHYLNGLLSFGWNILFGYLSINAFVEDRIFDGAMISSLLWFRFYYGGIENSGKFAEQKNIEIFNDALLILQSNNIELP